MLAHIPRHIGIFDALQALELIATHFFYNCENMGLFFKLRRLIYIFVMGLINLLLAIVPSNFLRLIIFKFVGVKLGSRITLERGIRLDFPWRLTIGNNCHIGKFVYFDCRGGFVTIGEDSDISEGAIVYTLSHDIQSEDFCTKNGDVAIGNRNWICVRAVILPGTCLGLGNVLSANSVFSGTSTDFNLLVGNPAQPVKQLSSTRASRVRR